MITVRAKESFTLYDHDETEVLGEVEANEVYLAILHEESGEYFIDDKEYREILVGEIDVYGNLKLSEDFEFVQNGMTQKFKLDFLFHALASMGNASGQMSWANTCVGDIEDISDETKAR
ncbi:hypothetical protein J31TS6_47910 [Brevibacillus reuszeri]|uniref:hypothetical protein n=1 Tax=Brevibacillus reuszeri TaxID=54915 RepID=UPI001B0BA6DA|nr:hypothetical protein [Brevibacillus reuszeri]GIO08763.1 hypothetical protein J31TS6_47910 [Brevibacillus reuszeri]